MALTFDGVDDYVRLNANLFIPGSGSISSSKSATLSCWFKGTTAPGNLFLGINSGGNRFSLSIESSTGKLVVLARNAADSVIYAAKTAADYTDGDWHHVLVALDLANSAAHLYVDRVSDEVVSTGPTDDTIDFAGVTEWIIGANTGGTSNFFTGEADDFVFIPGFFLDASDAGELAKVVSSDGRTHPTRTDIFWQNPGPDAGTKQVGYGADGSKISELEPPILMLGKNFQINRGTGQNFVINGSPADSRGPLIYRQSALRSTPGERWFDSERSGFSYPRSETIIEHREGIPSYNKRIGIDEVDDKTRQESPGLNFSQLIMGTPGLEDDSEDNR